MANIDGAWNVTVNTPMGAQNIVLSLDTSGGGLTGTLDGAMGKTDIKNAKADGDSFSFEAQITEPFPVNIEVHGTAEGDALSGQVKTQGFGSFPMKGTRA